MRRLIAALAAAAVLAGCATLENKMLADEHHQFDFLLGTWDVKATRRNPDGSLLHYEADWHAVALDEGRVVMDEFRARGPDGQRLSNYVTLRTYSPATHRWEMAGLAALQPAAPMQWHGEWRDGEMRIEAEGADPQGRKVLTRIRFFDIQVDRFAWESQMSMDGGGHWLPAASLHATRVAR
jgi:hypothetical protein